MKHLSEYRRRISALVIAATMLITLIGGSYPVAADEVTGAVDKPISTNPVAPVTTTTYSQYIAGHGDAAKPGITVSVAGSNFIAEPEIGASPYQDKFGSVSGVETGNDTVKLTYTVEVPETGLYNMVLKYYALPEDTGDILLELLVDGVRPFTEAGSLNFGRVYTDGDIQKDVYGNDVEPDAEQVSRWITQYAYDIYGGSGEYYFYLTAGAHEMSFITKGVPFLLESFSLQQKVAAPTYEDYLRQWEEAGASDTTGFQKNYQAEGLLEKSDSSILVGSDRSSSLMEPFTYEHTNINILNGAQWTIPGQWVSWEVEVEESGFYTLGFKYRQSYLDGLFSSRKVLIDGEVPFEELEAVQFDYTTSWKNQVAGEDTPYRIYLTAGEKHTITLENVTGALSQTIDTLQICIDELNELYLDIMMITGSEPDPNRDYYLKKSIPDITERFTENANAILAEMQRLTDELGMKGSEMATYENVAYQLLSYGENVASLTTDGRLSTFQSDIVTLSSKLATLQGQGLDLDYLTLSSVDMKQPRVKQNFLEWLVYTWKTFITSFSYREVEESEADTADLEVWIVGGSDQLQIVEKMVDGMFTQQHGISVDVKLSPGTLLQATASGLAPDVALNVDSNTPVNFALRGALVDLSTLDGFEKLKEQYIEGSFTPFTMDDVVFAIPATQVFQMMFVRDDVLQDMGLKAPKTWEELLDIAPIIQRHNMQIGVGGVTTTVGATVTTGVFAEILYQSGGSYYTDDLREVAWDENVAVEAFKTFTSFFTDYSFPLSYDAVTRFRTGEMPIFITSYGMYNNIRYTAPEIDGLWSMKLLPGVEDENGTVHHTAVGSSANASIIFGTTDNLEDAWTFLKWWADGNIQAEYGNRMEARLGISSRYATANRETLKKLQWTEGELSILNEQMKDMVVLPILPGYYYVNRGYTNSFTGVVNQGENPREVLLKWTKLVNEELERKQKEFDKNN